MTVDGFVSRIFMFFYYTSINCCNLPTTPPPVDSKIWKQADITKLSPSRLIFRVYFIFLPLFLYLCQSYLALPAGMSISPTKKYYANIEIKEIFWIAILRWTLKQAWNLSFWKKKRAEFTVCLQINDKNLLGAMLPPSLIVFFLGLVLRKHSDG